MHPTACYAAVATILVCGTVAAAPADVGLYRVVAVHDGDTLTAIDAANVQHKVRLAGIDAPETRQPYHGQARHDPPQRVRPVRPGGGCGPTRGPCRRGSGGPRRAGAGGGRGGGWPVERAPTDCR
jgi:hypothetical protein